MDMPHIVPAIVVAVLIVDKLFRVLEGIVIVLSGRIVFENVVRMCNLRKDAFCFFSAMRVLIWMPFSRKFTIAGNNFCRVHAFFDPAHHRP